MTWTAVEIQKFRTRILSLCPDGTLRIVFVRLISSFRRVLYVVCFFWVIPRRLEWLMLLLANLFPYHFSFLVYSTHIYLPVKMEQCSETSAYKLQTPGHYPKESIQYLNAVCLRWINWTHDMEVVPGFLFTL